MSGFEVVGVVLAVWPLVVNGLQIYKSCKSGQGWGLLLQEFKTERIIYIEFVCHLLAPEVTEAELHQLTVASKPDEAKWKDKKLNDGLRDRLGKEKCEVVVGTLEEMEKLLRSLTNRFGVDETDLATTSSKIRRGLRALQLTLTASSARENLKKLRNYNSRLQRLFSNSIGSMGIAQERQSRSASTLPPEVLARISANANDLHDALVENYRCSCIQGHEAHLGSQFVSTAGFGPSTNLKAGTHSQSNEPLELLFPFTDTTMEKIVKSCPTPLILDGKVNADTIELGATSFSDTSTQISHSTSDPLGKSWAQEPSISTIPTSLPDSSVPPFDGHKISLSTSDNIEEDNLIQDLCYFIKSLGGDELKGPCCLGVLEAKERRYIVNVTSLGGEAAESTTFVSLEDYLSPSRPWNLSRQKRMDLALSLSLAILQFFSTQWVDDRWSFRDFSMLRGDTVQIFVTKKFFSSRCVVAGPDQIIVSPQATMFWDCINEPILTRLGLALTELALGRRLSDLRAQNNKPNPNYDMIDVATAKKLVHEGYILEEAGRNYHDAVKACLEHQVIMPEGVKGLNSRHANFQADLETFIVTPVRECYLASWKSIEDA